MNREHWTSDELINYIYGLQPDDGHLALCAECRTRLQECQLSRASVEAEWNAAEAVPFDLLAAQRRRIYQAVEKPRHWWSVALRPQWASAAVAVALLAGGATFVEQKYSNGGPNLVHQREVTNTLSDSQLANEVSSMADSSEPSAAAPLQGLFED